MELLAKFDLVMKQHIEVVESGHSSYLGNIIQNEPIASINRKMLDTMVIEMKQSKYYSIIWDCTPDVSHQEQMDCQNEQSTRNQGTFYISCGL